MKLALDPYMFRRTPLLELPALVAGMGFMHIELSPREDFMRFFTTLDRIRFDGLMPSRVSAWEDRARATTLFMREQIAKYAASRGPRP